MASLSWGADLYLFYMSSNLTDVVAALGNTNHPAYGKIDVVNTSWISYSNSPTLRQNVRALLGMGVTVVSSAGNTQSCQANGTCSGTIFYPAAYNFDDLDAGGGALFSAQVIAVSASTSADQFRDGYKYSPGVNPSTDATNSYIDVAAPGSGLHIIHGALCGGTDPCYWLPSYGSGTSLAGPMVAATAALMLRTNPALTPPEVYEAITRGTDKVDQSRHPDIHFSGGLGWNQYTGYGRLNAFRALKHSLENFGGTLGGSGETVEFLETVSTAPGVSLNFRAGSTVELAPSVSIGFKGPVAWLGTSAAPIWFKRSNPSSRWGYLSLLADGNTLEHVILDGGYKNIDIVSRNNTLRYVTSRDGWRNLSSGAPAGGGRAQATILHSTFENATSVGAVVYQMDLTLDHSTIQHSAQAGLWVSYGDVSPYRSVVTRNGVVSTSRSGVELNSGSDFDAAWYALNEIDGNARHEIKTSGSAVADLYIGHNTVCDAADPGTTGKYVYEGGSYAVEAENNWWGTDNPQPSFYHGDVTYYPWDYYPNGGPCASSGGGNAAPVTVASAVPARAASVTSGEDPDADDSNVERPRPDPADLRQQVRDARGALASRSATADAPALASRLYLAQRRLDRAEAAAAEASAERAETLAVLDALRQGRGASAERAALIVLDDALRGSDTERARKLLDEHGGAVRSPLGKVELAAATVEVLRREGRFSEALAALGTSAELLGEGYVSVVEADLLEEAKGAAHAGVLRGEPETVRSAPPLFDTGLAAPYPNPSAGRVTVPITVAATSDVRVSVYDALGREVAVLTDGPLGEGRHPLILDASPLPAGLYVVRATVASGDVPPIAFSRRLTVVR